MEKVKEEYEADEKTNGALGAETGAAGTSAGCCMVSPAGARRSLSLSATWACVSPISSSRMW